jgi:hypothetical protein
VTCVGEKAGFYFGRDTVLPEVLREFGSNSKKIVDNTLR